MAITTESLATAGDRPRPRPSMADALAASGGAIVTFGVLLLAIDAVAPDDGSDFSGTPAGLIFAALIAASFVGLFFAPRATHAGWITTIAFSVPLMWGFFILPKTDSFDDIRIFLLLSILTWAACFFIPRSSGRPIFIALAALALYLWVVGEVGNVDAYFADSIPLPKYSTPAQVVDAVQGGAPEVEVQHASLRTQTLEELDPNDPLYPLAQDCANGDDFACDQLWNQSTTGSDFEAFAQTCGGRSSEAVFGECSLQSGSGDFGDDFTDTTSDFGDDTFGDDFTDTTFDFGDDFTDTTFDFGDDFTDDTVFPGQGLDVTPLSSNNDDKSLEIAMVSLLFGAAYLGAKAVFDRRRWDRIGTAFVLPGSIALIEGVAGLGDASNSAVVGGLVTMAAGLGIGVLGYMSRRRFSTWVGGITASIGAGIIAFEVADTDNVVNDNGKLDLVGPGVIFILFGLGVVVLGFVLARVLEDRDAPPAAAGSGPGGAVPPPPSDPLGPYVPAATAPTPQAWAPPTVPTAAPPASPSPSPWAPVPPASTPPPAPAPEPPAESSPPPSPPAEPPAAPSPWAPPPTPPTDEAT